MKRNSVLFLLCLFSTITFISCEHEYEDAVCTCPHGGAINGWEEPDDTTSVNRKDTTGGFEVILEDWEKSETHDISI